MHPKLILPKSRSAVNLTVGYRCVQCCCLFTDCYLLKEIFVFVHFWQSAVTIFSNKGNRSIEMDLKQRFKELLNRSKDDEECCDSSAITCSVEEFLGISEGDTNLFCRDLTNTIRDIRPDPLADQEILDTVEAAFVDENCDGGRYQLNKLSCTLDLNVIRGQRQILGTQLGAVSHKLFSVILQKQAACSEELGKVLDLQDKLDMVNKLRIVIILCIFENINFDSRLSEHAVAVAFNSTVLN